MGPRASRPPGLAWPPRAALPCPTAPTPLPVPYGALRRGRLATPRSPATGALQDIPDVLLQLIMEWGSLPDIAHWAVVDRRCLAITLSEELWRALCVQRLHLDRHRPLGLRSFCSAFYVHHRHADLVGVWQVMEDYPYGDLLQLAWRQGCLEATSLHPGQAGCPLFRISFEEEEGDPDDEDDVGRIAVLTHIALHWHPDAEDADPDAEGDVPWSRASWELQTYQVAGATRTFMSLDWDTFSVDSMAGPPLPGPPDPLLRQAMQSCGKLCTSIASMTLSKVFLVPEAQKWALRQAAAGQAPPSEGPREPPLPLPGLYSGHYGSVYGSRAVEFVNLVYLPLPPAFSWAASRDLTKHLAAALERVCCTTADTPAAPQAEGLEWWLVALKATGDEHVPLGEVSFRVKVSGEAPGPAEDRALAAWAGLGQLALPGFKGAYWSAGTFQVLPHGDCCFAWSAGPNFNVQYSPVTLAA
eukprot:EG_transcript_3679